MTMTPTIAFALGIICATVICMITAFYMLTRFSVDVYDGIVLQANKIREHLTVAARLMDDPEGTEAINDAIAVLNTLSDHS